MADSTHSVSRQAAASAQCWAGYYTGAVGAYLLDQDIPLLRIYQTGPYTNDYEGFVELEVTFRFTDAFADRLRAGDGLPYELVWDAISGWYLIPETYDGTDSGVRWMSDGLAPAPHRVEAFLLSAQVELEAAGSDVRPYYRQRTDPYTALREQTTPFLFADLEPDHAHPHAQPIVNSWEYAFKSALSSAYLRRTRDALASDRAQDAHTVPLRAYEIRALIHLLDLAQRFGESTLAPRLAADLQARLNAAPDTAQVPADTARTEALAMQRRMRRARGNGAGGT